MEAAIRAVELSDAVAISASYPRLAAEKDGALKGYAYACRHRERAAYRYSVDVSEVGRKFERWLDVSWWQKAL